MQSEHKTICCTSHSFSKIQFLLVTYMYGVMIYFGGRLQQHETTLDNGKENHILDWKIVLTVTKSNKEYEKISYIPTTRDVYSPWKQSDLDNIMINYQT